MIAPSQHSSETAAKSGKAALVAVLAIFIALGIFQRLWTERTARANTPEEVNSRLQRIPLRIATWEGQDETSELPEYPPEVVGPIRSIRYVNRSGGETLWIFVTAGPTGPMLVNHLPTQCYTGIGYDLVSEPIHHTVASPEFSADFLVGQFTKTDGPVPSHLRVIWSFSGTGDWQVPRSPRIAFARSPTLYKLYVVRRLRKLNEPLDKDPANEFIRDLIPELRKALFSGQQDRDVINVK